MDNLDFRKWLTEYGYTYEEYEKLDVEEKKKIEKRFKSENAGNTLKSVGDGIQGCGCMLILLPILAILIFFIWGIITS